MADTFFDYSFHKNKGFAADVQDTLAKYPAARVAFGVISFPAIVLAQSLMQNALSQFGFASMSMEGTLQRTWHHLTAWSKEFMSSPKQYTANLIENTMIPIGHQLIFAEVLQNYLLKEKAHSFFKKVGSRHAHLIHSNEFTLLRIFTASLASAYWTQAVAPTSSWELPR